MQGTHDLDRAVAELRRADGLGAQSHDLLQRKRALIGGGQVRPARHQRHVRRLVKELRRRRRDLLGAVQNPLLRLNDPNQLLSDRARRLPCNRGRQVHQHRHARHVSLGAHRRLLARHHGQEQLASTRERARLDVDHRGKAHFLGQAVQQLGDLDRFAGLRDRHQQSIRAQDLQMVVQQLRRLPDESPHALAAEIGLGRVCGEQRRAHPGEHHQRRPAADQFPERLRRDGAWARVILSQPGQGRRLLKNLFHHGGHRRTPRVRPCAS